MNPVKGSRRPAASHILAGLRRGAMSYSSDATFGKDSPGETSNIPGRLAYLKALNRHWPEVLEDLREVHSASYAHLWKDKPEIPSNTISAGLEWTDSVRREILSRDSIKILDRWARSFALSDRWIKSAAVETMLWHYSARSESARWIWFYMLPHRSMNPPFATNLKDNIWNPSEPWEAFAKRIRYQTNQQLSQYRSESNQRYGTFKTKMKRDAGWTVRYQRGEHAKDIAEELYRGYEEPAQAVYRAIERFAKAIGLTLPNRRRRTPE
jgi:hypothetical protein